MENLKKIKKLYGEKMSHLCRNLFPDLLENDTLCDILTKKFEPSRSLYSDLENENKFDEFKILIESKFDKNKQKEIRETKNPYQLMLKAGYTLKKIETVQELKYYKKYYQKDELLCTFKDCENRINNYHIFFAIKNDIDNIKRGSTPRRQDDYGVSCISIQIQKKNFWISIKNRYNHSVDNSDSTFSNNLDNIIEGLTYSFNNFFNFEINKNKKVDNFELKNYINYNDTYYKYNYEIDNIYYCSNNIILQNGKVKRYDKSQYIIIDYFIIDKKNKKISFLTSDGFVTLHDNFKKLTQINNTITIDDSTIVIDEDNKIIHFKNNTITKIEHSFLYYNKELNKINIPNVKEIGYNFLYNNKKLNEINLQNVTKIGHLFLNNNEKLNKINIPNVKEIGAYFLNNNKNLNKINLQNVTSIEYNFLYNNKKLNEINLQNVTSIGNSFLYYNEELNEINLQNVKEIGAYFLNNNENLNKINIPNVKEIGAYFLYNNKKLNEINLQNVTSIGHSFLHNNKKLNEINLQNVTSIGHSFLYYNEELNEINLQNVKEIGAYFLYNNENLNKINIPNVKEIGAYFLYNNKKLNEINLQNVTKIGHNFLHNNKKLLEY